MKKYSLLLIALAMSGPAFAATMGQHTPIGVVTLPCDPGSCSSEEWLCRDPYGYECQSRRAMRHVNEVVAPDREGFSSQAR